MSGWRTGSDLQRGYRKKVVHLNEIIRNGRLKSKLVKTLNFCISKTIEIRKRGELSVALFRYLKEATKKILFARINPRKDPNLYLRNIPTDTKSTERCLRMFEMEIHDGGRW